MPELEEHYSVGNASKLALPAGIVGGIVGAIIGVLVSLFAIFNLGLQGLFASLVLGIVGFVAGFAIAWLGSFIWYASPPAFKKFFGFIFLVLAIVGIIWLAIFLWSKPYTREYLKFALPLFESISKGWRSLKVSWGACFELKPPCPFLIDWESPYIQRAEEQLNVEVEFSEKKIIQDRVNLLVSLTVSNPEIAELRIRPKCYLGKDKKTELQVAQLGSYAVGNEFVFGTTAVGQKLRTSFRCVGEIGSAAGQPVYSEYVVVVLERPVNVKTTWPVQIGKEPRIGFVKSVMEFNAPYSIAMFSNNDMPFEEGKEYGFSIVMKKKEENVRLSKLEYMSVKFPEELMVWCDGFKGLDHELEIKDYSYEALQNITDYDKTLDKFSWPCSLYVTSAPRQATLAPITLESKYIVYSEYSTRIIKSP